MVTKKSDLTRNHILMTGRELVLRKGYGGTGLKELLDHCQVPKGSFYYYFASKEAFGCDMLSQYFGGYMERIETLFASEGSGYERLMRYWRAWIEQGAEGLADRCLVIKLAAEVSDLSEDMRQVLNEGVERLVARIAAVIAEGQRDGSISSTEKPETMAQSLYAQWLGAAILSKLSKHHGPMQQALRQTEAMLPLTVSSQELKNERTMNA